MNLKRYGISVFALAAMATAAMPALGQTQLKLGHIQPPNDSIGIAAEQFAELVNERTNGEVEVIVHPGGELGGSGQLAEGVRLGTVDMIITGTPFWSRFEPMLNVLDLPCMFEDYAHAHAVADSDIAKELVERLEKHNVHGLTLYEIGYRNVTNSERPVNGPDDLKGLKLRVSPNKAHTLAFQLLGANPVSMSFTEVYLALQTGAIDGQENPIHIIATGRLEEVQDHLSLTEHAYSNSILAMNQRSFERLTPEQQEIVLEAAHESAVFQRQLNAERQDGYLQQLKDAGMQVVEDVDREAICAVVKEPVWADFVENNEGGQEYIDRIVALAPKS